MDEEKYAERYDTDSWAFKESSHTHQLDELVTSNDVFEIGVIDRSERKNDIDTRNKEYRLPSDESKELLNEFVHLVETKQEIPGPLMRYIAWGAKRQATGYSPWEVTKSKSKRIPTEDLLEIARQVHEGRKRSQAYKFIAAKNDCDVKTVRAAYKDGGPALELIEKKGL
ncbi:MAG: hypothetical protein KZQ92_00385 [Candidatus Thiodiazotropha sp. (ex Lucinoma borealis)]|nr:hypothetical protein [Candidatus Thiodiazotropha sp. (ex Lucinoma borealis)]